MQRRYPFGFLGWVAQALWVGLVATGLAAQGSPQRIVSLAPSLTEILLDLGAGDALVGVTRYDHDPAVAGVPRVGGWLDPSYERIAELQPDMVLITRAQERFVGPSLARLGIRYRALPAQTLQDVFVSLDSLARWLHLEPQGRALRQALQETLRLYRARSGPRLPVVFVADRTPGTLQNLYVVGSGTFLHELLEIAGYENLVKQPGYVPLNLEHLLRLNPPLILEMVQGEARPDSAWQQIGWQSRVVPVEADLFSHPSTRFPRILRVLRRLRQERQALWQQE